MKTRRERETLNIILRQYHIALKGGGLEILKRLPTAIRLACFGDDTNFSLSMSRMQEIHEEKSIAEMLFLFFKENEADIQIQRVTKWLLEYWAYEMKAIQEGDSNLSQKKMTSCGMTCQNILKRVLEPFLKEKFLPAPKDVFVLLNNSQAAKDYWYSSTPMPYASELNEFIEKQKERYSSFADIRNASRVLGEGYRGLGFYGIPREVALKIATYTADPGVHTEKQALEIAKKNFDRPKL